jgi:hypothetical protein
MACSRLAGNRGIALGAAWCERHAGFAQAVTIVLREETEDQPPSKDTFPRSAELISMQALFLRCGEPL